MTLRSKWSLISGVIIVLCIAVNLVNNHAGSSFMAACMLLVVWGCCVVYLNECRNDSFQEISEVLLASGIGYGIVFVVAFLLLQFGIDIPGVATSVRLEPGMIMQQSNMYQNQLINLFRLRGFTIDPNTMIAPFLYSTVVAMLRIAKKKGGLKEAATIVLSAMCIFFSNSRMGLICFCVIIVGSIILGYKIASPRIRNYIKAGFLVVSFLLMIAAVTTDLISGLANMVISVYANRSGLMDEYGRFSIWTDALSVWWDNNILFGIGLGQMQYYTATSRACHNTWLELICGCGIVVGLPFIVHFGALIAKGLRFGMNMRNAQESEFALTMLLGIIGVMLSLLSVDNVTFSYLWFGSSVVAAVLRGCCYNGSHGITSTSIQ